MQDSHIHGSIPMAKKKTAASARSRPRRSKVSRKAKKSAPSVAAQIPEVTAEQIAKARKRYAEVLIASGQAVPLGESLMPGATHEIVGHDEDGSPVVSRRRFSLKK